MTDINKKDTGEIMAEKKIIWKVSPEKVTLGIQILFQKYDKDNNENLNRFSERLGMGSKFISELNKNSTISLNNLMCLATLIDRDPGWFFDIEEVFDDENKCIAYLCRKKDERRQKFQRRFEDAFEQYNKDSESHKNPDDLQSEECSTLE